MRLIPEVGEEGTSWERRVLGRSEITERLEHCSFTSHSKLTSVLISQGGNVCLSNTKQE